MHNSCSRRQMLATVNNAPPSSSFPFIFIYELKSCALEHHFGPFGSAVLAVPSPKVLLTPSLLVKEGMLER